MPQGYDPFQLEPSTEDAARAERVAKQRADDLNWLMGSPAGRRIAHRLLEQTGVFRSSYTGDNETFFREGQRNIGLMWLAELNAQCPEAYGLMVKEHNERTDS